MENVILYTDCKELIVTIFFGHTIFFSVFLSLLVMNIHIFSPVLSLLFLISDGMMTYELNGGTRDWSAISNSLDLLLKELHCK